MQSSAEASVPCAPNKAETRYLHVYYGGKLKASEIICLCSTIIIKQNNKKYPVDDSYSKSL